MRTHAKWDVLLLLFLHLLVHLHPYRALHQQRCRHKLPQNNSQRFCVREFFSWDKRPTFSAVALRFAALMYAIPRAGADAPKCDANTGRLASFLTHVVLSSEGTFRSNLRDWTEAIPSHGCGAGWRARARGLPSQRAAETAPGELPSHTKLSWFWSFQASTFVRGGAAGYPGQERVQEEPRVARQLFSS